MLEGVRALYDYSAWANIRILDTAERLDREQFVVEHDGSDAIRNILVHVAWAQWLWLERWQGSSPRERWDPVDFPDVASLRYRWAEVERASADYVASLKEPGLERVVAYVNSRGQTWSYPLWQQLLHQVNHATQHRAEAALLLTETGSSPGDLDFLVYFDEQGHDGRRPTGSWDRTAGSTSVKEE